MSDHSISPSPEITYMPEHAGSTSRIWKVFWILSVITLVELGCGYWIYTIHNSGEMSGPLITFLKGVIAILTLAKAYFIVSVFMHLGDEIRNFIMTIVVPLILFIWFIIAFVADGASWKALRNTNAHSRPDTHVEHPVQAPAEGQKP